jgi:hypothetical protein
MIARIERDENGDHLLTIPDPLLASGEFAEGDVIEFCKPQRDQVRLKNLSCQVLRISQLKRNLNSVMRNINNPNHHLNRVLIKGIRSDNLIYEVKRTN